jgi:hypothetical protein
MFFLSGLAKLAVIAAAFFFIALWEESGVVYFIQGLATAYLGLAGPGLRRLLGSHHHGT